MGEVLVSAMIVVAVVAVLVVGGALGTRAVLPDEAENALALCEGNEGWKKSSYETRSYTVSCNNGAKFKISRRKQED